jgi:hypothetical protein
MLRASVFGQDTGLIIDGVAIKLGMPQTEAMELLQRGFTLGQMSQGYAISSKAGPPFKLLGAVSFKDGKVSWVSKRWGQYSGRGATELANALVGTLDSGSGGAMATITVEPPTRTPELTLTTININFGTKSITLLINESRDKYHTTDVSVDENLLAKPR